MYFTVSVYMSIFSGLNQTNIWEIKEDFFYLHVLIKLLLKKQIWLKNEKLPANIILGQTPQNTPQQACRIETPYGQHRCGACAYKICIETALCQSWTYVVCVFMSQFLKIR